MPTKRTFSFVFRGKQVQVEREYASDEEELINTKPRCLWPDDGRDYTAQEDDYYDDDEQQWDQQHEDETRVELAAQHHHDEHSNHDGYEQQDSPGTPPPTSPASTSPIPPSPHSQRAEYNDNNLHDQHDAYEEEEHDPLPPHPTINRGYVAESITMVQHQSQPTSSQQHGDYTDEEDDEHNAGQDDTMYTALYDSSDNEEASPMYSQENSVNPFEHIPNPEEDWLIAQERERQRIASRHKLGIVGRGIKYPIPADLLEAPSPTTTFGRTTLWPIRVEAPESSMGRQRLHKLTIPAQPNFSIGPAFNLASASVSSTTSSAPSAQTQSLSTQVTPVQEEKKKGRASTSISTSTSTSTSTVVTRPAQPNEIQAIYAAILGRRKVPEKEQEEEGQSRYQDEGIRKRQNSTTGGSGSSLYGSEEEQEPEEKLDVLEEDDEGEATLAAEELLQEKLAELGPFNPALKRHVTAVDECEVEDEADEDDTLHAPEQVVATGLHKCEVFDGLCWGENKRELTVGVYWLYKGERSLRCVHRRFDKFQLMGSPDADENSQEVLQMIASQRSTSQPTTPQLSLDTGSLSSGYLSS